MKTDYSIIVGFQGEIMLIFDIETLQIYNKNFVWQYAGLDTITGDMINVINIPVIAKVLKAQQEHRPTRFFEPHHLEYFTSIPTAYRDNKQFYTEIQEQINNHKAIAAYNIAFDLRHLKKNGIKFKNQKPVCLWGSFVNAFVNHKFVKWSYDNEKLTDKGNIQTNAEVAYQYLANDLDYKHLHYADTDVISEAYIWERIKQRKQKLEAKTSYANVKRKLKRIGY